MDAVDREIRFLAGIRSSGTPVVSVHLDTRWADEQQRERVRLFVDDGVRKVRTERGDDAALMRTLDRVLDHVDGLVQQAHDTEADGVALFACEGKGLFRAVTVQRSFRPQRFEVLEVPDVLPLLELHGRFPPAAVALVDAHGARLIETALAEVTAEALVAGEAHRRHAMGGWSQKRYQRHVRRQIQRNHREAAEVLGYLVEQDPRQLLALAGPDRVLADFERVLPERVRTRVFLRLSNPRERSDREARVKDELLQQLFAELVTHARIEVERDVDAAVGEALAGGNACLGPGDVTLAANEGRIHRLILHQDLMAPAWLCRRCDALHAHQVHRCDYCAGPVAAVPLSLELARKVLGAQGQVEIAEASPELARHRGVAAVLRARGGAAADLGASP